MCSSTPGVHREVLTPSHTNRPSHLPFLLIHPFTLSPSRTHTLSPRYVDSSIKDILDPMHEKGTISQVCVCLSLSACMHVYVYTCVYFSTYICMCQLNYTPQTYMGPPEPTGAAHRHCSQEFRENNLSGTKAKSCWCSLLFTHHVRTHAHITHTHPHFCVRVYACACATLILVPAPC